MKVLIAIDGSDGATAALKTAVRLFSPAVCNVDLLCVAPAFPQQWRSARRDYDYDQRILGESTHILERARGDLNFDAKLISLLREIGSPSAVIVDKTEDYDLTVIGAKGCGAGRNIGLGPVASRVVEHALGSVLVGRALRSEGGVRVLVAVDGSTASVRAVETLRSLFDLSSTEICLMHVAETPWIQLGLEEDWVTYSDENRGKSEAGALEKELVREGEAVIEQARGLLQTSSLLVNTRIVEGNPANEILSEAERGQYDLIVVGATGARDLKHRMLGSVSSKIAWNACCSVLIVREPE